MYDKRAEQHALRRGIRGRLQALENDLLQIEGISDIGFDIDIYGDYCTSQVILVPRYHIDVERPDYFDARKAQLHAVLDVCEKYDLHSSGDRIEDQGAHWYIVRTCGQSWPVYRNDDITRRWLVDHDGLLDDVKAMTPRRLAEACTYCRDVDNPFARELVTRSGNLREFLWATDDAAKCKVLRAAAKSFGCVLI
ncbi:MAG: hypothetical protein IJ523_10690 [Succinivibrionaceae bacterium]|nr:hypothetical protein [Succinivibrionaceae bacterium]